MQNVELSMSLDEAVAEVLGLLTGLDLTYDPELERYRSITRALNRAMRYNALDNEWSFYASDASLGTVSAGETSIPVPPNLRPRIVNDDAVRLVSKDGRPERWAYFLPRDALHKYNDRQGLWCASVGNLLVFSREFTDDEQDMEVLVPVMREPRMFRLPPVGTTVPPSIRKQLVDFPYPDLIVARAAFHYAQTDPVMQPRVPTLEDGYKNLMYQLIERDTSNTDTPYTNEFILPLENGLRPVDVSHRHPHSNFS